MNTCAKIAKFLLQTALLLSCIIPASHATENFKVLVVLSDAKAPYQTFAQTFKQNLPSHIQVSVLERAEDFSGNAPPTCW